MWRGLGQRGEEGAGVGQVGGIEAFGELGIEGCEQVVRRLAAAL